MNATARKSDLESLSDHLELDDLADPPEQWLHRTKLDLIAESRRIRDECNELVRLYQKAVGTRRSPQPAAPDRRAGMPTHVQDAPTAAWRKKALLLLLIEELV